MPKDGDMRSKLIRIVLSGALVGVLGESALAAVPEAPRPQTQARPPLVVAPVSPGKPAWLTPEKEAALVEVRKILKEARQVAERIDAPSKPRETSPPEDRFTREERNKMGLLASIEKAQFRAGDFSASATTMSTEYLAFAQLHYGQVRDAVESIGRERLLEDGTLSFVYALSQAGFIGAAIEVAETQIKKEPVHPRRLEAALFALIAHEQTRAGDLRARESLQRARQAAKMVGPPNDRALAWVRVARTQRSMDDRAGSHETLRLALDTAMNAPRGRSAGVLRIIAVAQEESDDTSGSVKTFAQAFEDEKSLKLNERVQRIAFEACDLALRGYRLSAAEMFQVAIKIVDELPVGERVRIWSEIGKWLVQSGDYAAAGALVQRMVEMAETIVEEQTRKDVVAAASVLAARVGDLERAIQFASMTHDEWRAISLFRVVVEKAVETNHSVDTVTILRQLGKAVETLPSSPLPSDRSQADGRLSALAKVQAVTGNIPLAVQTLKRITGQDYHQASFAYPEIIKLLTRQGNYVGARQIVEHVEKKWLKESLMASTLQDLSRAYAESGASQEGLQWARQMEIDFAKAAIFLGVAEGLMNRHGIEKIVMERPEVTLRGRCSIG
jgi:tetratricopeptide (TPR) repeat protein